MPLLTRPIPVFARHVQRPAPAADLQTGLQSDAEAIGHNQSSNTEPPAAPGFNPAMGFDWNGDLSLLVDSGLGDASQLWLWADNLNYDSFAEFNDANAM